MHPITYEAFMSAGLAVAGIFALMGLPVTRLKLPV
jgi:hypothetical protein